MVKFTRHVHSESAYESLFCAHKYGLYISISRDTYNLLGHDYEWEMSISMVPHMVLAWKTVIIKVRDSLFFLFVPWIKVRASAWITSPCVKRAFKPIGYVILDSRSLPFLSLYSCAPWMVYEKISIQQHFLHFYRLQHPVSPVGCLRISQILSFGVFQYSWGEILSLAWKLLLKLNLNSVTLHLKKRKASEIL